MMKLKKMIIIITFMSKYNNYKNLIKDLFKKPSVKKPIPYWGVFYIPLDLYNFLIYLDNWCKIWNEEIILRVEKGIMFEDAWKGFVRKLKPLNQRVLKIFINILIILTK